MIDVEKQIYKRIVNKLVIDFPDIFVYGESIPLLKAKFPCVVIEEQDNYTYNRTQDSGSLENHAVVMYEVNVYSNRANGKKDECKAIQKIIDEEFLTMGFSRLSSNNFSLNDATLYRIVSRYTGVVSKDETVYRRD